MTVRAKFYCHYIQQNLDGSKTVHMNAVYHQNDPAHENSKFNRATPSGNFSMTIDKDGAHQEFESGTEYYLDFTRALKPEAA